MPRRRILAIQQAFHLSASDRTHGAETERTAHQVVNIDELLASPWVGLHYRHEFLLHYSHELLEQHHKE